MDVLVALATTLSYVYSVFSIIVGLIWTHYDVVTFFGIFFFFFFSLSFLSSSFSCLLTWGFLF